MQEEIQKQIAKLRAITNQANIRQVAMEIAEKAGVPAIMKATRALNTFQKKDVIHAILPSVKKDNLIDLLDLLEAESKPVHGREEATVHSGIIKELFEKISELLGENVFEGVSLIDQIEIKRRIELLKNRK